MNDFVNKYKKLYYYDDLNNIEKKEYKAELGIKITCVQNEVEHIAEAALEAKDPIITMELIAWKAGRLKYDADGKHQECSHYPFVSNDGKFAWDGRNGWGHTIENTEDYINIINHNRTVVIDFLDRGDFKSAYKCLLQWNKDCHVKQLGAVYMITLIYFLSKGKYPIYDRFAHKAAEALCYGEIPSDVNVECAPDKTSVNKVIDMYNEYCGLLKKLFGTYSITREQDQALWVYGHSKKQYSKDIEQNVK